MLLSKFWFESMRHSANVTKQKGMDSIAKNSNVVHQMQDFIHLVLESIHSVLILTQPPRTELQVEHIGHARQHWCHASTVSSEDQVHEALMSQQGAFQ